MGCDLKDSIWQCAHMWLRSGDPGVNQRDRRDGSAINKNSSAIPVFSSGIKQRSHYEHHCAAFQIWLENADFLCSAQCTRVLRLQQCPSSNINFNNLYSSIFDVPFRPILREQHFFTKIESQCFGFATEALHTQLSSFSCLSN